MSRTAPNINHFWADLIIEELVRNGVRHFFLAPGSRSSPLVAAIAQHPTAEGTIHFDERGAAFAALGYGRASRRPAAWVTTSGTAAANGLPAVVEAAQSHIPLVLLTADRPPELRDAGANQAIDQIRLFGSYARWFFDLPCPAFEIDPSFVLTTVDQAVHRAVDSPGGAVHLNCPYREPLAPTPDNATLPAVPDRWLAGRNPYTDYRAGVLSPDPGMMSDLFRDLGKIRRGLIVVGELATLEDAQTVMSTAAGLGWPVIADVTSQTRLGGASSHIVPCPHFTCAALSDRAQPDAIIRLGGPVSSKDIQQFVDSSVAPVLAVRDHPERKDPGHCVSRVIRSSTATFCEAWAGVEASGDPDWLRIWTRTGNCISSALQERIASFTGITEPGVAAAITRALPEDHALFAASSMPIRDVDMFGSSNGSLRRIAANRGASGIDGTVASAVGYHIGLQRPVTLLIGDLALLHDLNSLALLEGRPIVVVVINNNGGGIFNFLPIADHEEVFEPWFTAPHCLSFEHAARLFGMRYVKPGNSRGFIESYKSSLESAQATLIEVVTERRANRALHSELRSLALATAASNEG